MKEQFVTYEIAKGLKEVGFDEPCLGYYRPMKNWMMEGNRFNPEPHFHGCNWASPDCTMYFMYVQNPSGDRDRTTTNSSFTKAVENIAVPLWQQVIDWLREKRNIDIDTNDLRGDQYFIIREAKILEAIKLLKNNK